MQLHRRDVVAGATAILDEYGLADLTMRRLAATLGVGPGALYWHFPNKQALLGAVSDAILSCVAPASDDLAWTERLRGLASELREALLACRDGAEVVASSMAARTLSSPVRGYLIDAAGAGGLGRMDSESSADALLYYVLGAVMDEQSRMQMDSAGAVTGSESTPAEILAVPSPTARFVFGLNLFIDGVVACAAASPAHVGTTAAERRS